MVALRESLHRTWTLLRTSADRGSLLRKLWWFEDALPQFHSSEARARQWCLIAGVRARLGDAASARAGLEQARQLLAQHAPDTWRLAWVEDRLAGIDPALVGVDPGGAHDEVGLGARHNATVVPIRGRVFVIGRSRWTSDLWLANATVAREHAVVVRVAGGYVIRDLNSTNGIVVDGVSVAERSVAPGDTFQLGECAIEICACES